MKAEVSKSDKEQETSHWKSFAPLEEGAPCPHEKMPKLLNVGNRADYPTDFLDTVERVGIICDSLEKILTLCYHVKKDFLAKQSKWAKASETFKQYGEEMMTKEIGEVFTKASKKFAEISTLYLYVTDSIRDHFTKALEDYTTKDIRAVRESLKKLCNSKKAYIHAKARADRKPQDQALASTAETAKKDHDTQLEETKQAVLKFLDSTSFFHEAAIAFISSEKEVNDKARQALLKVIYTY